MDGILSQEEISALLNDTGSENATQNTSLTDNEKDAIGEIANISMGTAATTLFSLVNRKVEISTPVVSLATWDDIVEAYERPCVFIRIAYTVGLDGNNLLILKENDGELGELHLSAICEAMNQMMGSAATSLSSMLNKTIDISPPHADLIDLQENVDEGTIDEFLKNPFVKISFKMEIGDLVNSTIMQLYPISFAKEMCASITQNMEQDAAANASATPQPEAKPEPQPTPQPAPQQTMQSQPMMGQAMQGQPMMGQPVQGQPMMGQPMMNQPMMGQPMMGQSMMGQEMSQMYGQQQVNVQPAQFQAFTGAVPGNFQPENIDLIMDVPLEVTVELGRTSKSIKEILDFTPGTIIELNRIAGEPIDVLVNGKFVAKGEVVVIEESYGIRITEIIK